MEIVEERALQSGYQPRPAALPAAGEALSVLLAVCAVLWVWWMLPDLWPLAHHQLVRLVHSEWAWTLLPPLANWVVFRQATRPVLQALSRVWPAARRKYRFVLLLCLLFHVVTLCGWLLFMLLGFMLYCVAGELSF
ncbi:hypothetical protein LRS06_13940 [Hymenobacter sp. J193]|uniref:hypothetical protein n=1 Tax=Hymenobacter sp. J193 TaxID=2898429 RepID=UPI002150BA07|nr:hypothetical protein [Hymenobacter sp. J193]MCR5888845.1 hypothetical protein [Hymenobacter sp. J193]